MKSIEILEVIADHCSARGSIFFYEGCYDSAEEMVKSIWGEKAVCRVNNALKGEKLLVTREPLSGISGKAPSADAIIAVFDDELVSARYVYNLVD